jgi:type I restriction enzyme R subunit
MKRRFIEEPANLKLLIVVSKLLTGFDAPSCTYIYLDNELRDHNLFQAICRTNRLDGEDKDYGHIVDYKESLENVQKALAVYTSDELDTDSCGEGAELTVKDWREEGRAKLDAAREALIYLCAPVKQPQGIEQHIHYFCGSAGDAAALNDTEPLRIAFYKAVAAYVRAYADLAQNLEEAGYSTTQIDAFEQETAFYTEVRAAIKNHAGEELDTKPFEADMRHLINTYIQADPADVLGDLSSLSLTELIIETGIHDAIARKLNEKGKLSNNAIAEGIINNVRKTIIRDQLTDPKFYEQMSKLLEDLIQQQRDDTESYAEFLKKAEALAKQLGGKGDGGNSLPTALQGNKEAAVLYNNLPGVLMAAEAASHTEDHKAAESPAAYGDECLSLTLSLDQAIRDKAPAGWKGDPAREAQVLNAIFPIMKKNKAATLAIFEIIKNQPGY